MIVASNGGSPTHPDWYYNLKAHPSVEVELGTETFTALAEELDDDARDRVWPELVAEAPSLGLYRGHDDTADSRVLADPEALTPGALGAAPGVSLPLHPEDDPRSDASRFDVGDCLVDVDTRGDGALDSAHDPDELAVPWPQLQPTRDAGAMTGLRRVGVWLGALGWAPATVEREAASEVEELGYRRPLVQRGAQQ